MDKKNSFENQESKPQRLPLLIVIITIVFIGVYLIFAQFDTSRLPVIYLQHTDNIYTNYFELDSNGNETVLEPVFGNSGSLTGFTGSVFLDSVRDPASDAPEEGFIHRIGYTRIIFERMDHAQLVVDLKSDVRYIIFLDDTVLHSDYPDPRSALSAAFNRGAASSQSIRNFAQKISIDLPPGFTGMTLKVVEFITPEQALLWSPVLLRLETFESESFVSIMTFGSDSVIAGSTGAVVILLTVLLAFSIFSSKKTWWLLILPVLYGVLVMVRIAFIEIFTGSHFWPLYEPVDFISGLTYLCGGNLLLVFIALRSNHQAKYALIAASLLHLIITAWYLVYYYITFGYGYFGYEHVYDMSWLAIFGSVCITFAFVLMMRERKENRYFKLFIWTAAAFITGYILMMLISRFTNFGLFSKLLEPVTAVGQLDLYPLNNVLYLLILLLVAVFSMDECITEIAERRLNLSAFELTNHMKTEFLGNMSYELKTPLTSVSVLGKHSYSMMTDDWQKNEDGSDELQNNLKLTDEVRDNLRLIVVESDRMRRIIDGLLNAAVIEQNELKLQREYLSVTDLIREIGGIQFKAVNTNDNTLKFNFASDLPRIYADRNCLQEVFLNLLSNAARHTKNGTIVVAAKQERKRMLLSISDNGEGIPEDMQKNLFKRFLGADIGRAHGTGLGLYICKQIIELHRGSIRIDSKPGTGTTVYIDLPVDGAKHNEL